MKLSVRYQTNDMSPHLCLFRRKDLQNWLISFWSPMGCTRTITRWIQNFTPKSHWSAGRQQVYIHLQYRSWWTGTKFNSLGGRWSTETWRWSWRKEEVDMYQIRGQRGALAVDSDSPECWTLWYYHLRDCPKEESSCADFLDIAIFKQCVSETICTSLSNMWFFRCDSMCEMKIQPKMPLVQIRNMDLTANRGLTLVLVLVQIRFWRTVANMHLYLLCPPFWLSEKLSIEAALSTNYSTVWYGIYMVFYGMVWYGMARYCMAPNYSMGIPTTPQRHPFKIHFFVHKVHSCPIKQHSLWKKLVLAQIHKSQPPLFEQMSKYLNQTFLLCSLLSPIFWSVLRFENQGEIINFRYELFRKICKYLKWWNYQNYIWNFRRWAKSAF